MTKPVFISVAFGDHRYLEQLKRLEKSIKDADTMFWTEDIPGKPFLESLYGFKVHAVKEALKKGYKKIVWCDPSCVLVGNFDKWFELTKEYGVLAAKDDSNLTETISDKALKYYGNPDITGWHLVGGSLYVFEFPYAENIFNHWAKAEEDGIFGSQEEASYGRINKHRNDESCMSMALYMNGSKPLEHGELGYNGYAVMKKHFK